MSQPQLYIQSGIPWELTWQVADFPFKVLTKKIFTQTYRNLVGLSSLNVCCKRYRTAVIFGGLCATPESKYNQFEPDFQSATMPFSPCRGIRLVCLFSVFGWPTYATDPLFSDTLLRQRQVQTVLEHKPVREISCQNPIVSQVAALSIYQRLPRLPAYRSNRNNALRL